MPGRTGPQPAREPVQSRYDVVVRPEPGRLQPGDPPVRRGDERAVRRVAGPVLDRGGQRVQQPVMALIGGQVA
ncbi:MAG: hypothetical protein DLM62_11575 [Pseudonocardiales bacterium]|nr:MAG: hypothetical protein DLM62_11575 [Pseudonocardiales bacterium]